MQEIGICRDSRKGYVKAAKLISRLEKPLYLGEVDSNSETVLKERYNVTSYPTYMVIYSFGRDPETLTVSSTDVYATLRQTPSRIGLSQNSS